MPEEALLGRVVPAVPSAGHGPPQRAVLHQLDELQTGVVGPLVAVDHGLLAQRDPMVLYQQLDRFQNKIHFQRFAHRIGQDLLCAGVQDRGEVAESAAERDVCDVRQEDGSRPMRLEFPVDQILRGAAHSDGSLQSAVGIRLSDGAGELVFPHQTADLLHVHSDTHVQKPHMNAANALCVGIPVPGLRKGRSRHSYAAFAHGYPNEREEDPPSDAEIQAHLPHPKAESLPQIAAIHPNGQRRGEFGQPGIRVSWAESHPPDGHHIHPALRQILLPLHDPGRLHKAGPGLCDERIAGSGFCFGNGPAADKAPWDLAEQGDRDPQRPGDPLHQSEVHPAGGEQHAAAVHVPQRELLGQRAPRELLRAHEGRAGQ